MEEKMKKSKKGNTSKAGKLRREMSKIPQWLYAKSMFRSKLSLMAKHTLLKNAEIPESPPH